MESYKSMMIMLNSFIGLHKFSQLGNVVHCMVVSKPQGPEFNHEQQYAYRTVFANDLDSLGQVTWNKLLLTESWLLRFLLLCPNRWMHSTANISKNVGGHSHYSPVPFLLILMITRNIVSLLSIVQAVHTKTKLWVMR